MRLRDFCHTAVFSLLMFGAPAMALSQPRVFFSDLESAPATGGENNQGAWVTVYGERFGASQGNSQVNVGGGHASVYRSWSDTKIIFQLGSGASTGDIVVKTSQGTSNGVPFTVRSGSIFFVAADGNDGATGSFAAPWKTLAHAMQVANANPGSVVYAKDGVSAGSADSAGAALTLACNASVYPSALAAYPGATVTIDGLRANGCGGNWTIAGLTLRGARAASISGTSSNWRFVANDITCAAGSNACFETSQASFVKFYGNSVHDAQGVSFGQDSNHLDIGWNTVANLTGCRGIEVHSTGFPQFDLAIHDNRIHDVPCDGIAVDTVDPSKGGVSIYNNLVANAGLAGIAVPHSGDAHGIAGSGVVEIFNNTLYSSGINANPAKGSSNGGIVFTGGDDFKGDIRNNLIHENGLSYFDADLQAAQPVPYFVVKPDSSVITGQNNLVYGGGSGASFLPGTVTADPQFAAPGSDFHVSSKSPAANGGTPVNDAADIDGIALPQGSGYPIGAFAASNGSSLTVTPAKVTLSANQTQTFSANGPVTWSLNPPVGTLSAAGLYTAPATIGASQTILVTATSTTDSSVASATVTLSSVAVTINPSSMNLMPGQSAQLNAAVTGTSNPGVVWSLASGPGTLSASGVYTAPDSALGTQMAMVTATSAADPTKSATATIAISSGAFSNLSSHAAIANSAVFVKTDTTTSGTWKGVYGAAGYNVLADSLSYPAGLTVTPSNATNYTWASSTADTRGLQSATASKRVAGAWYNASPFLVDFNFTDASQHQIALYMVDWDGSNQRSQKVEILDGSTNTVLDTRNVTKFSNGQYLVWQVSGHVIARFTMTGSFNAVVSGLFFDTVAAAAPTAQTVSAPAITPGTATYTSAQTVTISSPTSGATIRYTTDGSTPSTTTGTLYSAGIPVSATTTVKAIAYKSGWNTSAVASATLTFSSTGTASNTALFVKSDTTTQGTWKGTYGVHGYNVIDDSTAYPGYVTVTPSNALNYVWTNSTTDTRAPQSATAQKRMAATWYNASPFTLDLKFNDTAQHQFALYLLDWDGANKRSQTVDVLDAATNKVIDSRPVSAFSNGRYLVWNMSGHVVVRFTMTGSYNAVMSGVFFDPPTTTNANQVAAPTFGPASGTYASPQSVSISTTTSGASIRYTTDGSTPTKTTGNVYSSPLTVSANTTVKAIAYAANMTDSAVSTATYAIQVAAPAFTPAAGVYSTAQSVALSSATAGASIRYTTDGSTPSSTVGTLYSSAITVGSSATIKAIAYKANLTDSAVSSAAYTISTTVNTASFVKSDAVTQGTWKNVYGVAGYNVIGDTTSYPSYVKVTPSGQTSTVWSSSTTDVRALQSAASSTNRVAAAWSATSQFTLDLLFSDTAQHQVSAYLLDWNTSNTRNETVTILDGTTNAVLDTENVTSFTNGQYLVWKFTGHVIMRFSSNAGGAVVSGLFFDTPSTGFFAVAPKFSPAAGTFTSAQTVTISTTTSGATIRYTTDGVTTPTETVGTVYSSPITVSKTTTIKAIAFKSGMNDSSVTSGTFTISAATSHSVVLNWQASQSSNITGYKVYRSTVTGGPYTLISSSLVTGTSYTDTTVSGGTTYYYVVTAVDSSNVESSYSPEVKSVVPAP